MQALGTPNDVRRTNPATSSPLDLDSPQQEKETTTETAATSTAIAAANHGASPAQPSVVTPPLNAVGVRLVVDLTRGTAGNRKFKTRVKEAVQGGIFARCKFPDKDYKTPSAEKVKQYLQYHLNLTREQFEKNWILHPSAKTKDNMVGIKEELDNQLRQQRAYVNSRFKDHYIGESETAL